LVEIIDAPSAALKDHSSSLYELMEVKFMGKVLALMKVMPASVDIDLETLKNELGNVMPPEATLRGIREEPIAFGLVALKVSVVLDDVAGGTDAIENAFTALKDVSEVQVEAVSLL
jgi:elongation factor 1-beta